MLSAIHFRAIGSWVHRHGIPLLPEILDYATRLTFSCWFPHSVRRGRNLVLGYGGLGIVIHSDTQIDDDVHIEQGVTIGGNRQRPGVPAIGSRVYAGASTTILDPIRIGEDCVVGANAVVLRDILPRSVAVGVPARVIRDGMRAFDYLELGRSPAVDDSRE